MAHLIQGRSSIPFHLRFGWLVLMEIAVLGAGTYWVRQGGRGVGKYLMDMKE